MVATGVSSNTELYALIMCFLGEISMTSAYGRESYMDNNEMKDNMDSPVGEKMPLNGFEQSQMSQGMPQQFGQSMMPMGGFGQPQFGQGMMPQGQFGQMPMGQEMPQGQFGQMPMGQGMPQGQFGQMPMGQGMPQGQFGQMPMGQGMPQQFNQMPMGQGMPQQFGQMPIDSFGQPQFGQGMPQGQFVQGMMPQGQFSQSNSMMQPEYSQQFAPQGFGQQMPPQGKTPGKGKKIAIIASISALVVAGIVIALIMILGKSGKGASSPEAAAKAFLEAWADNDVDKMIQYSIPDDLKDAAEKYVRSEEYSYYNRRFNSLKEAYEYGYIRNLNDGTKVRNLAAELGDKATEKDIKESEAYIKEYYGADIDIQEMVRVKLEFEVRDDGYYEGEWEKERIRFDVYKTGGKWYVFPDRVLD